VQRDIGLFSVKFRCICGGNDIGVKITLFIVRMYIDRPPPCFQNVGPNGFETSIFGVFVSRLSFCFVDHCALKSKFLRKCFFRTLPFMLSKRMHIHLSRRLALSCDAHVLSRHI